MKITVWVVAILLLVAGVAIFIEALTTTNTAYGSVFHSSLYRGCLPVQPYRASGTVRAL
jgi:hypothetical protein